MTPEQKLAEAEKLKREAHKELEEAASAAYEKAAKAGYVIWTESEHSAASYYGLKYRKECDVFDSGQSQYLGDGDTVHLYAVVPKSGFTALEEPERRRRELCKKSRAERHRVFERIRRFAKRSRS